MSGGGAALLTVRGLAKRYGAAEVLRGIDLDLRRGEIAAIIGPSGSGKSTLLRAINYLEPFDAGEVRIGDLHLRPRMRGRHDEQVIRRFRRRVGMVFQQFNLFPHLTALDNVVEGPVHVGGLTRTAAEERARALLAQVDLSNRAHLYPAQLSGGQQQRVAIARTLAMEPEVILFDEPTSALDPELVGEVLAVMRDLAARGQTMMVVTHEMGFARGVASRVLVFEAGRILEQGSPDEVFDAPREPRTQEFLRHVRAR